MANYPDHLLLAKAKSSTYESLLVGKFLGEQTAAKFLGEQTLFAASIANKLTSPPHPTGNSPPSRLDVQRRKNASVSPPFAEMKAVAQTAKYSFRPADKPEVIRQKSFILGPHIPRVTGQYETRTSNERSIDILSDSLKRLDEIMANKARQKIRGALILESLMELHSRRCTRSVSFAAWHCRAACGRELSQLALRSSLNSRIAARSLNALYDHDVQYILRFSLHAWYAACSSHPSSFLAFSFLIPLSPCPPCTRSLLLDLHPVLLVARRPWILEQFLFIRMLD
jgi:hypothetical protein